MVEITNIDAGLRVDVDTFRGTRDGVPALLELLRRHDILASFFFSVGPDNMGRHLWRLLRPAFLAKMLRSRAPGLYGWNILLRGTLWPGPEIGKSLGHLMREAAAEGHEVGIHAWDHHAWQMRCDTMSDDELERHLESGLNALESILGTKVRCSAAASWKCTETVLQKKERYQMLYHSDCRGTHIFRPLIEGRQTTPQIPVTLPTYDEVIGTSGIDDDNFNQYILEKIKPDTLNVLTVHAEVEGITKLPLFDQFLDLAHKRNIRLVPLGKLLVQQHDIPLGRIVQGVIPGREGRYCLQESVA